MFKIVLRNAWAHKGQALALLAASTVATAVVTAAFIAGGAAEEGIKKQAYDSLGEVDLVVSTPGATFFPEALARDIAAVADAQGGAGMEVVFLSGAARHDDLGEPQAGLFGLPPDTEGLGDLPGTWRPGDGVAVNDLLAEALDLEVGDPVAFTLAPPVDPQEVRVTVVNGTATPLGSTVTADVRGDAREVIIVLLWQPQAGEDLDLVVTRPDGSQVTAEEGLPTEPDIPIVVRSEGQAGDWTMEVTGNPATASTPYTLALVELTPTETASFTPGRGDAVPPELLAAATEPLRLTLTVGAIVPSEGLGGLFQVPVALVSLDQAQQLLDREDLVNHVLVSGPGGVRDAASAAALVGPLDEAASVWPGLSTEETKANWVRDAERAGEQFTRMLSTLSSFTVASAALLIVSLLVMVAQERRREWGVLRAIGLPRSRLAGLAVAEGLVVGLPGLVPGLVVGIGIAYLLITIVNRFLATEGTPTIPFVLSAGALGKAALVLTVVLGLTLLIGVVLVTRFHVASAVRGLPDPKRRSGLRWQPVALSAGLVMTGIGIATGEFLTLVVGPMIGLFGLAHVLPLGEHRWTVGSLAAVAYGIWTVGGLDIDGDALVYVGPVRGTLLALFGVTLLVQTPALTRALRSLARRGARPIPRLLAAAYPAQRPSRTVITATMFALVILILSLFSVFFALLTPDVTREAAGWDVMGTTTVPLDGLEDLSPEVLERVERVALLPTAVMFGSDAVRLDGEDLQVQGPPLHWVYGIGPTYVESPHGLVRELNSDPYASVLRGQGIIASRTYDIDDRGVPEALKDGGRVSFRDVPGRSWPLVAVQDQVFLSGLWLSAGEVEELFPRHATTLLAQAAPGVDPEDLARDIERDLIGSGGDVDTVAGAVEDVTRFQRQFYLVIQVFLGLGLVIGVSSLGVLIAKAADERAHELAVMRAMGLGRVDVGRALLLEALTTAGYGVVPGLAVGIAVAYAIWASFVAPLGVPFTVPWVDIGVVVGIAVLAAVLSTVPTARRVTRRRPGQDLRLDA